MNLNLTTTVFSGAVAVIVVALVFIGVGRTSRRRAKRVVAVAPVAATPTTTASADDPTFPMPRVVDSDPPTISMEKLKPYAEQLRREGYAEGEAVGLRALQAATRPPVWLPRSRRPRQRPGHDLSRPDALRPYKEDSHG